MAVESHKNPRIYNLRRYIPENNIDIEALEICRACTKLTSGGNCKAHIDLEQFKKDLHIMLDDSKTATELCPEFDCYPLQIKPRL